MLNGLFLYGAFLLRQSIQSHSAKLNQEVEQQQSIPLFTLQPEVFEDKNTFALWAKKATYCWYAWDW